MADQLQALRVVAERLVDWNRHWPDDRWYSVEQIKQMDREMRAINAMAQHALAAGEPASPNDQPKEH